MKHRDFVLGFITQHQLTHDPSFIHFTPGINCRNAGDSLGQQYQTPEIAFRVKGVDVAIVGRGITHAQNPAESAKEYQKKCWIGYKERTGLKI